MSHSTSWQGKLELTYSYDHNKTILKHAYTQAPLKVQQSFYPEGDPVCHNVILHTAGGMVGGDSLRQDIQLQSKTHVLMTTAAAAKIYRSNGPVAQQDITISIDPGACLEWLPQETILFNGAIYQQTLRVELAPQGHWLGWEITRLGRTARGERFLNGEWRSHLEIWQQGKPLWIDRQYLRPSEEVLNSYHGLGGYPLVGSLVYIGEPVSRDIIDTLRTQWQTYIDKGQAGVTQTLANGVLCRYRGESMTEIRHEFIKVWHLLRQSVIGCSPIYPRVWQL